MSESGFTGFWDFQDANPVNFLILKILILTEGRIIERG